ncbi:MAG: hypothetical protein HY326_01345, partial [Chloroflexi bacterium]|nr:hypothetical protein [Chloroflexota bacterium]
MPGYLAPIIWLLAALLLPGAASFLWLDGASWVPGWLARLAVVIALGLTTWPVLLLWSSLIGLKYNTALEMAVLLLSAAAVLAWVWRARHFLRPASSPELPAGGSPVPRLSFPDAAHLPGLGLVLLLLLAAWTRWQPLALWTLPAWIDGVHHAWITQLINLDQRLPSDFGPLLPAAPFLYHFGFHALAALPAATGVASAAYSVLVAGQLLSLLVTLQVAAWAGHMLPSWPWAPVGAALVTGCLSLFPAYFVNWSRYPQLAGLVLLPALALLCAAFPIPARRRHHLLITFLAAGLALTHYRMALVAACVLFALAWSGGRFAGRVTGRISCRCGLQPHVRLQT